MKLKQFLNEKIFKNVVEKYGTDELLLRKFAFDSDKIKKEDNGNFSCCMNKLTELDYFPKYIGKDVYLESNLVKFSENEVFEKATIKGNVYV